MSDNSRYVSELALSLTRLLAEMTRKARARFTAGGLDITPDQWGMLDALADHGEAMTQAELADELGREKTVVLRQIDALERRGLLVRTADPHDRRKRGLVMTDEGQRVRGEAKAIVDGLMAELVGDTPAEELRRVVEALDEMRAKTRAL